MFGYKIGIWRKAEIKVEKVQLRDAGPSSLASFLLLDPVEKSGRNNK